MGRDPLWAELCARRRCLSALNPETDGNSGGGRCLQTRPPSLHGEECTWFCRGSPAAPGRKDPEREREVGVSARRRGVGALECACARWPGSTRGKPRSGPTPRSHRQGGHQLAEMFCSLIFSASEAISRFWEKRKRQKLPKLPLSSQFPTKPGVLLATFPCLPWRRPPRPSLYLVPSTWGLQPPLGPPS